MIKSPSRFYELLANAVILANEINIQTLKPSSEKTSEEAPAAKHRYYNSTGASTVYQVGARKLTESPGKHDSAVAFQFSSDSLGPGPQDNNAIITSAFPHDKLTPYGVMDDATGKSGGVWQDTADESPVKEAQ